MCPIVNRNPSWKFQACAELDQASPVQDTFYTILNVTSIVRLLSLAVRVCTLGETLELRLTIDGIVLMDAAGQDSWAADADIVYFIGLSCSPQSTFVRTKIIHNRDPTAQGVIVEAKSLKIELREKTATGAGTLVGAAVYELFQ